MLPNSQKNIIAAKAGGANEGIMSVIYLGVYLIGYSGWRMPKWLRRTIRRTEFHRSWLLGFKGCFSEDGISYGPANPYELKTQSDVPMKDAWKEFANNFNSMTDEEIDAEIILAEYHVSENKDWLEAVASWKAAGKPRDTNKSS